MLIYFSKSPLEHVCFKCSSRACLYPLTEEENHHWERWLYKLFLYVLLLSWSREDQGMLKMAGLCSTRGFWVTTRRDLERLIRAYFWQQLAVCDRTCYLRPSLSQALCFCWKTPKAASGQWLQGFSFFCVGSRTANKVAAVEVEETMRMIL